MVIDKKGINLQRLKSVLVNKCGFIIKKYKNGCSGNVYKMYNINIINLLYSKGRTKCTVPKKI